VRNLAKKRTRAMTAHASVDQPLQLVPRPFEHLGLGGIDRPEGDAVPVGDRPGAGRLDLRRLFPAERHFNQAPWINPLTNRIPICCSSNSVRNESI
jgi:hypothetical protein